MAQDATLSLREPPAAHRLRVRATYASLAVAAVLIAAKLVVWISTDSVALLSSLVDSFVDAAASLVELAGAGHMVLLERHEEVTAAVADLIGRVEARR